MIRKLIVVFVAAALSAAAAMAFDWKPKDNEALFEDMMEYARSAQEEMDQVPAAGKLLRKFISAQQYRFDSDPYAWIQATYNLVYSLEKVAGPHPEDGSPEAMVRRHTMRLLDFPIHVYEKGPNATKEEALAWTLARDKNHVQAGKRVVAALKKPAPAEGTLEVIKLYNMGYVFRTSKHTVAFDLCWRGDEGDARKAAKMIDCMFVSHPHGDHYTTPMLEACLNADARLILSKNIGPEAPKEKKLVYWQTNLETPVEAVPGVTFYCIAGNQSPSEPTKTPNNMLYVMFDGWTIYFDGDSSVSDMRTAYSALSAPDIAISATWNKPKKVMDVFHASPDAGTHQTLFISSHENEYGHRVQQRESYWETYTSPKRYGDPDYNYFPWMTMEAGESFKITHQQLNSLK